MRRPIQLALVIGLVAVAATAAAVRGQEVRFRDPEGDDDGPGGYLYPTDPVFTPGSFDLTRFDVQKKGDAVEFSVTFRSALEDSWQTGAGFSVQMVFLFLDTGQAGDPTFTRGLPGLNVDFAPTDAWNRCVILSPEPPMRLRSEVGAKVANVMQPAVLIPDQVQGQDRTITASVPIPELGNANLTSWGYQVVVQSNDEFPTSTDLLTRRVQVRASPQCFGGADSAGCRVAVLDCLAGSARGDKTEIDAQHRMLQCRSGSDSTGQPVGLRLIHPGR